MSTMDTATRRRGAVLEEAVLEAAWCELEEHGYGGLKLEGVAQRAGTSRPVLARRWPGRLELATAAIAYRLRQNSVRIADLGSVRAEFLALFRQWEKRGVPTLMRIAFQIAASESEGRFSLTNFRTDVSQQAGEASLLHEILARGVERGEIDPSKLTPVISELPLTLVRHELFMTGKPVAQARLVAFLDEIFLPLVAPPETRKRSRSVRR